MEKVLNQILDELKGLNQRVGNIETDVSSLKSDVTDLKKGQLSIETRIESEVIDKVRALFDGYTLRGDQIENLQKHLDQRLDSIEIDTGYLVARVARLEKVTK